MNQAKRMIVGYLSYVTETNKENRLNDFKESLNSLSLFKSDQIEFISIDNSSIDEVKNTLASSSKFSRCFHYKNNHYDIALFYTTMWYANVINADYICFLYDDFIVYDDALDDTIKFMDQNPDVSCVRIPFYDYDNKHLFDSEITPKSKNPDSVRHYNFITQSPLTWEGPFKVGNHIFYKNNWHYTSRPTIWRKDFFDSVLRTQGFEETRILQGFEDWAQKAFEIHHIKTAVLNNGMVKTTPVSRSARGLELPPQEEKKLKTSLQSLTDEYRSILRLYNQHKNDG